VCTIHRYITKEVAQKIDEELLSAQGGFNLDQLSSMSGQSVADVIYETFPPAKVRAGTLRLVVHRQKNNLIINAWSYLF
jgi:hypothetical protein